MCSKVFVLGLVILVSSCRKLVSDDFPDFPSVPAINSVLIADSLLTVNLSLTDKIGENILQWVENAQVTIKTNDGLVDTLVYAENGTYKSRLFVQPMNTYSCQVKIPGYNDINCKSDIPETPKIISILHINESGFDEEGTSYSAVKIKFRTNPEALQYYQIGIKLLRGEDVEFAQLEKIVDPILLNEGVPLLIFSNELIEEESYTMTVNYTTGSAHSNGNGWQTSLYPFVVELRAISSDYYMFLKSLYLYEKGRYPSDVGNGAVTNFNIYSNIAGGYGIFAGYSYALSDTIYPN
ncbi:MAG: DUF4249 domain-containing protein [Bacteroidales bacterium]|nr:DUF4249 domain-containing protein [Bacteroidales bacterium]MBN2819808.1 DUF4249 domain-containing protein [Bacteroidales bacterium]